MNVSSRYLNQKQGQNQARFFGRDITNMEGRTRHEALKSSFRNQKVLKEAIDACPKGPSYQNYEPQKVSKQVCAKYSKKAVYAKQSNFTNGMGPFLKQMIVNQSLKRSEAPETGYGVSSHRRTSSLGGKPSEGFEGSVGVYQGLKNRNSDHETSKRAHSRNPSQQSGLNLNQKSKGYEACYLNGEPRAGFFRVRAAQPQASIHRKNQENFSRGSNSPPKSKISYGKVEVSRLNLKTGLSSKCQLSTRQNKRIQFARLEKQGLTKDPYSVNISHQTNNNNQTSIRASFERPPIQRNNSFNGNKPLVPRPANQSNLISKAKHSKLNCNSFRGSARFNKDNSIQGSCNQKSTLQEDKELKKAPKKEYFAFKKFNAAKRTSSIPKNVNGNGSSSRVIRCSQDYNSNGTTELVQSGKRQQGYLSKELFNFKSVYPRVQESREMIIGRNLAYMEAANQSSSTNRVKDLIENQISYRNLGRQGGVMTDLSEYQKEMMSYRLTEQDPGYDFAEIKGINFRNIWNHLIMDKETNLCKSPFFMTGVQTHINARMRGILIDWLIDVHKKFRLRENTLFIAINIIDRSLEKINIQKQKFQLLGITALFIASKYEEIYPPPLSEYTYVCADAYADRDLLMMEAQVLEALGFNLIFTSVFALFKSYAETKKLSKKCKCVAFYLLHLALLDDEMMRRNSAELVAGAVYLALRINEEPVVTEKSLEKDFQVDMRMVVRLAKRFLVRLADEKSAKLTSCKRKFDQSKFMNVSTRQLKLDFVLE